MEAKIKNGEYSFQSREWDTISHDAKCLIKGMLETIPEKRFTIEDVINSNWIKVIYRSKKFLFKFLIQFLINLELFFNSSN
jgi:calcium-dependent protein kinase